MLRRGLLIALFAVGASFAASPPSLAHRGHHGYTRIIISKKNEVMIIHDLSAQDVEPELVSIAPTAQPSIDDPDAFKALTDYLEAGLLLNGQKIAFVEMKADGDALSLIFKGKIKSFGKKLKLNATFFANSDHFMQRKIIVDYKGVKKSVVLNDSTSHFVINF